MTRSSLTIRVATAALMLLFGQLMGAGAFAAPQVPPAAAASPAASQVTETPTPRASEVQPESTVPSVSAGSLMHATSTPVRQPIVATTTLPSGVRPVASGASKVEIVPAPRPPGSTADRAVRAVPPSARAAPPAAVPASASTAPIGTALDEAAKQDYSSVVRTFVLLSLLSALPILLIGMTSFTRIIIVLSLLRHALGLPETPPNSVLVTLAIFLTLFSMAPVVGQINTQAVQPYLQEKITATQAVDVGIVPLRDFMVRQTRESDLAAVVEMSHAPRPRRVEDIQFAQLAPAFLFSELSTAFQIGFIIFLPFLLVDIVVAAILMALGMIMVPPSTISLPVKILLFILINGWVLVSRALLNSYWS